MSDTNELLQKIDTLIRLQAASAIANLESQKEKILFLSRCGMAPKLIAEILGTSPNSVSVALSKLRKAGSSEDGKQE